MEGGGEGTKSKDSSPAAPPTALKKGPWTAEEDAVLIEHVRKNGEGNWNSVQRSTVLARCGKSCRLRWANHLRPDLKKGQLTPEEEQLVLRLHAQLGNKWARMAAQLPGRTDNEIKNYWNTRVKRRQRAGMPLYPPTFLQCPRPPPVFNSMMTFSPLSTSAMQQLAEVPRGAKRAREDVDGMMMTMFQFPVSPGPSVMPRIWHTAPSTPTGRTMFDYGGIMPPPMTPPMTHSSHVLDGGGEVELMDKLLREEERRAGGGGSGDQKKKSPDHHALNCGGGEAFVGLEELEYCRSSTPFPTNYYSHESDHLWIGDDMIPTQQHAAVTTPPDWNNSDGGQSVLTNDDLTVDQHQLASPSSPTAPDWNIASCHWNNMPELV